MLTVKILGSGCPNCRRLEAETRLALDMMDPPIAYELVKVTDFLDIANYGVLSIPALLMDEQILCAGRIPRREQIAQWARERENNTG
jgi:small redox-active disulfide protein 2